MKKVCVLVLGILLLLSLCACTQSQADQTYSVEKNRRTFTVDLAAQTISDGYEIYHYTFSGNTDEYQFTVTYQDGSTWSWSKKGNIQSGGGSDDYNDGILANGAFLRDLVLEGTPSAPPTGSIAPALLLIAFGAVEVLYPRAFWFVSIGWRIKDAQPSKLALLFHQIMGAVAVIMGIILFFPLLFG